MENAPLTKTQWLACLAAIMSAICAGFSAYATWKNTKHSELSVRPRIQLGSVVLHQYPSQDVLEIGGLKNVGGSDAQSIEVTLFIRRSWARGTFWKVEVPCLAGGDQHGSVYYRLGKTVSTTDGDVAPNECFRKHGIQIKITYENTWTREDYSDTWEFSKWNIRAHDKDDDLSAGNAVAS